MTLPARHRSVLVYLFFTWCVSSLFYFLMIKSAGTHAAGGAYVTGLMWSPAAGALLACRYLRRPLGTLGWKWGGPATKSSATSSPSPTPSSPTAPSG